MQGQILGRHRVTHLIGVGGMAEVWAAQHLVTGREVAVKLLLPEIATQRGMVERFLQEARAAACVDDPGIVKVIDSEVTGDGRPYLILERLRGESLGERLKRESRLSVDCALSMMRQLARTMATAHDQGVVHRDLKPDNLYLVRDPEIASGERVKVLDFGLAKLTRGIGAAPTIEGVVMGTPAYMAPEQTVNTEHLDHRADLYSMGCILYRMLCGVAPFGTAVSAIIGQRHHAPRSPRSMWPEIPLAVSDLVMQLLHKSPDKRVSDCRALTQRIDDCLNPVVAIHDEDSTVPVSMRDMSAAMHEMPMANLVAKAVAPAKVVAPIERAPQRDSAGEPATRPAVSRTPIGLSDP